MFPAHAGMNRIQVRPLKVKEDVPRTRGDEPIERLIGVNNYVCSPHTRG